MRETCICEQPTRSAISDWSRSSWNRRRRISLALVEDAGHLLDRDAGLDALELGVLDSDQVAGARRRALLLVHRRVERADRAALGRLQRLHDLLLRAVEPSGDVGHRGRAAEVGPQRLARLFDGQAELLQVTRRANIPGGVAEVAPQLAEDRGDRVAREGEPAIRIPAVDGLHEADRCDLDEVVERLGRAAVAQREAARERHVAFDQLVARGGVAALVTAHEALVVALAARALGADRTADPGRSARALFGIDCRFRAYRRRGAARDSGHPNCAISSPLARAAFEGVVSASRPPARSMHRNRLGLPDLSVGARAGSVAAHPRLTGETRACGPPARRRRRARTAAGRWAAIPTGPHAPVQELLRHCVDRAKRPIAVLTVASRAGG